MSDNKSIKHVKEGQGTRPQSPPPKPAPSQTVKPKDQKDK